MFCVNCGTCFYDRKPDGSWDHDCPVKEEPDVNECYICHKPCDPNKPGTLRLVEGLERVRGSGEGVHPLKERKVLGPVCHALCQDIAAKGGAKQESLLA